MTGPRRPTVAVVGSFMFDLILRAPRRPRPGETVEGTDFGMFTGGKGFNQAVAARRCDAEVSMIGRLGADYFGEQFRETLDAAGIDRRFVVFDPEIGTGVASPVVDEAGGNSIIIVPRANRRLSVADCERAAPAIERADVLLIQLEVPIEASQRAAEIAKAGGALVVLNPAPAAPVPDDVYQMVDVLAPNEVEAEMLTGIRPDDEAAVWRAGEVMLARGARAVVITLGGRGAALIAPGERRLVPAYPVDVVDTTGAGDAFCGVLAVALAEGKSLSDAVNYASAAGALATTILGTGVAMPSRQRVLELMARG